MNLARVQRRLGPLHRLHRVQDDGGGAPAAAQLLQHGDRRRMVEGAHPVDGADGGEVAQQHAGAPGDVDDVVGRGDLLPQLQADQGGAGPGRLVGDHHHGRAVRIEGGAPLQQPARHVGAAEPSLLAPVGHEVAVGLQAALVDVGILVEVEAYGEARVGIDPLAHPCSQIVVQRIDLRA